MVQILSGNLVFSDDDGESPLRTFSAWSFRQFFVTVGCVKFTQYFLAMRERSDRAQIRLEWIERVVQHPEKEVVQQDGRIRRWARIPEMDGRALRVILLADGETVHDAFFDRSVKR